MKSNRRQIRPIVDLDSPLRYAIDVRDQYVAFGGVCSIVATTTSSTWSRLTVGGRPGRASSTNPSNRHARNRRRHFRTVSGATPIGFATVRIGGASRQDDPCTQRQRLRRLPSPRPPLQPGPLLVIDEQQLDPRVLDVPSRHHTYHPHQTNNELTAQDTKSPR